MKFVLISAALFSICLGARVILEEGETGGEVLYEGNVDEVESNSTIGGPLLSTVVRYPTVAGVLKEGEYETPIKYIKIEDNLGSALSGATIEEGGVGANYAAIEYYAPAFRGYDYNIRIYG